MLRKIGIRIRDPKSESAESESGTELADSGFLIIHEKQADSGSRIRIAIPDYIIHNKSLELNWLKGKRGWFRWSGGRFESKHQNLHKDCYNVKCSTLPSLFLLI